MSRVQWSKLLFGLAPFVMALVCVSALLLAVGAPPGEAYRQILQGAFESPAKVADVLAFGVPLLLCSSGLLLTFTAGLWNIGIEGQITMGAIFASAVALHVRLPAVLQIPLEILAAMVGGALWAMVAGWLRNAANVNEIFSGTALNYLATNLTTWLISGPWQPPEGGSVHSTPIFGRHAVLPMIAGLRVSWVALLLGALGFAAVALALRGTHWGLQLRAMGRSRTSAHILGVRVKRNTVLAMAACGALAGAAGAMRALGTYQSLRPLISGNIGFLALLVVMLASTKATWVPFIVFFFAAILTGSQRLNLIMKLDDSVGGVLQGFLVLFAVLMGGVRQRLEAASAARGGGRLPQGDAPALVGEGEAAA
jgi:simple sugar transport system permease protein